MVSAQELGCCRIIDFVGFENLGQVAIVGLEGIHQLVEAIREVL